MSTIQLYRGGYFEINFKMDEYPAGSVNKVLIYRIIEHVPLKEIDLTYNVDGYQAILTVDDTKTLDESKYRYEFQHNPLSGEKNYPVTGEIIVYHVHYDPAGPNARKQRQTIHL